MSYQPIYQEYLNQGGDEKAPLFRFILWGHDMASRYGKEYGISPTLNTDHYLAFVKTQANKDGIHKD